MHRRRPGARGPAQGQVSRNIPDIQGRRHSREHPIALGQVSDRRRTGRVCRSEEALRMAVGVRGRGPAGVMTIERAVELLSGSRSAVALTGAGVSAESGIPTFRGEGGLWSQYDPVNGASIDPFIRNPGTYSEGAKQPGPAVL